MGFGAIFLGIMFLYDFPIPVGKEGIAYMAPDMFPDLIGWLLLFFGVRSLAKKAEGLDKIRYIPLPMILFSVLAMLKDTLWFSNFYTFAENQISQNFLGVSFDVCMRLFEMAFLVLLFRRTALFSRKKGEDKLSLSHQMVPRIAIVEAVLFSVSRIVVILSPAKQMTGVFHVLSQLDNLFMVFLVWYAAISMVRALIRITD